MSETRFELDWQMEFLDSLGFLGLGGHLLQVRRRRVSAARRRRPARRTPPPTFTFYGPGFLHPPAKSGGFRRPLSRQPSLFRSMKPIPGSLSLSLSLSLSFVSIFPLKIKSKPQRTLVDVANRKEFLHFVWQIGTRFGHWIGLDFARRVGRCWTKQDERSKTKKEQNAMRFPVKFRSRPPDWRLSAVPPRFETRYGNKKKTKNKNKTR